MKRNKKLQEHLNYKKRSADHNKTSSLIYEAAGFIFTFPILKSLKWGFMEFAESTVMNLQPCIYNLIILGSTTKNLASLYKDDYIV